MLNKLSSGWFPPWPRGKPDFEKDRMKINWGAIRTYGHRSAPMYHLAVLTLIAVGLEGLWLPLVGILGMFAYIMFDIRVMFRQEQRLYFEKNPVYMADMKEIKDKLNQILEDA